MTNGIHLLTGIVEGIKAIIRLRKDARSDQKAALQIKRLEQRLRDEQRRIQPARFKDVRNYDPKVRALFESVRGTAVNVKRKRVARKKR